MKVKIILLNALILITISTDLSFSQKTEETMTRFPEIPLEEKHFYANWRTDYYVCTGIAYAKSLGKSAEDFAEFVGNLHYMTRPDDQTIEAVARTMHMVMTNYPGGMVDVLAESDTFFVIQWNRPYKMYFSEGPVLGVTIDEFETYCYEHVSIMTHQIGIEFEYKISDDLVKATLTYLE